MTGKSPAVRPTAGAGTVEATLQLLLDHIGRMLAEEYVSLIREGSPRQTDAHDKAE